MKTNIKKAIVISVLFILATSFLTSCQKEFGKGPVINEIRTVGSFTKIKIDNSATVQIQKGEYQKVEVSDYENLINYLSVETVNSELIIKTKPHNIILQNSLATVIVTTPDVVTGIKINGSGKVNVTDTMSSIQNVHISGSGSFDSKYNAYTSYISGEISGSGDIEMKGVNDNVYAKISGSGDINYGGLLSQHAVCNISGSGNITVNAIQTLNVNISGSGNVYYYGNPSITTNISGSGKIVKLN